MDANDVDATMGEAEATIARVNEILKEGRERLDLEAKSLGTAEITPEALKALVTAQSPEFRAQYERERTTMLEEMRQSPPEPQSPRAARWKPTRQMV